MQELRPYQAEANAAVLEHIRTKATNPLVVLPTGGGKTVCFAHLIRELMQSGEASRIILMAHRAELLTQAGEKLHKVWPQARIGYISAKLGKRQMHQPITIAGVASVYRKAFDLEPFDLAIIDECHLVPTTGEGMYRRFLHDAKMVCGDRFRAIGYTATPYRLDGGHIAKPGNIIQEQVYNANIVELIEQGYLCPIRSASSAVQIDTAGTRKRQGEYVAADLQANAMAGDAVPRAVADMLEHCQNRKRWLVFCCGVEHAHAVRDELHRRGVAAGIITGETPQAERTRLLGMFARGELQAMCNVDVLTTGLDITGIDAIALLRPTLSTSLYIQMVGRGLRLDPAKADCLVLDYGGNIERHGPIDRPNEPAEPGKGKGDAPSKECPSCGEQIPAAARVCPACGDEQPANEQAATDPHEDRASGAPILSTQGVPTREHQVLTTRFDRHQKAGKPDSVRVEFITLQGPFRMWLCFDHGMMDRMRARTLWHAMFGDEFGQVRDVDTALQLLEQTGWAREAIEAIGVRKQGKYDRVVNIKSRVPGAAVLPGQESIAVNAAGGE